MRVVSSGATGGPVRLGHATIVEANFVAVSQQPRNFASAPTRLADAEAAVQLERRYPWGDARLNRMWETEAALLVKAIRAASDDEARNLARQFLEQRDVRRKASSLPADLVDYERQREWLEGLAKYAELSIGRAVAAAPGYSPCEELKADADFKNYATRSRYWSRQLKIEIR